MKIITECFCHYCGVPVQAEQAYCCLACENLDLLLKGKWQLKSSSAFDYLDKSELRTLYRQPSSQNFDYLFFAEGLHCTSCVHLLEKLPQYCPSVLEARVNFTQSTVAVKLTDDGSLSEVAHTIQELGYVPSLVGHDENLGLRHTEENRSLMRRIAVAGFCAGNIMLFVVPVYAGLAGAWAQTFNILSLLLFLPILFYSAIPFYKGAWVSLKYKTANVDLPITVAMLTGFSLSTFNLIRGSGDIYFDSTASFLFFILSARFLLKRVQQRFLSNSRATSFLKSEKYLRIAGSLVEPIIWKEIKIDDLIQVQRNQFIPADAELVSASCLLDMSLYNGESLPRHFSQGMQVLAGSRLLDEKAVLKVLRSFPDSKLGQTFLQLEEGSSGRGRFVTLTDRLAQYLIITVFAIAFVFFIAYSFIDLNEAFNRALALIVLACPCALAFGSPLTLGLAVRAAQKKGILLKSSDTFEKMRSLKDIFFDKTGTLTEGHLELVTPEKELSTHIKKIILSLEAKSYHPIAFALRKAWQDVPAPLYEVENAEEILGKGVKGTILGDQYELRHLSNTVHDVEIAVELLENGRSAARLYFADSLRDESPDVVAQLKKQGLHCFLLSGDKKGRVLAVAKECGIATENCYWELFPEDKKAIIEKHTDTCMIGDGANDALSLQIADVGIAVKGSLDLSLKASDVYFTRGGLTPFLDLIKLSNYTRSVLIRNLGISLLYNLIGGTLALMGFITPLWAAILMPISSVIIILSSMWGFK